MLTAIKRFLFRQFKSSETSLHELNYLFWECTTRCNLSCIHCGSDCSSDSRHSDMPMDDFLRAIDTIQNPAPNLIVVISGGEPLMRNDLEVCGREIRKRGFRWSMVTNGHLYTAERQNSLLNAGLGALTISLDGLRDSHNWMRNNHSSFDRVISAIATAAGVKRLNFDVVTCVNQRNLSELPQLRELLISLNVKSWRLFTIIPIGRARSNLELFLADNQFVALIEFISATRKSGGIDVKFSCEGYVGRYESSVRDSYFFCRAGVNIGSILIDGSISACPNIDRSFAQGNIYSDNFFSVWQQGFQPFRNRLWTKTGACKSCSQYRDCQGSGMHNWHGDMQNVLVCHHAKIENAVSCTAH